MAVIRYSLMSGFCYPINTIYCRLIRVIATSARGLKWMVIEYGKLDARYWPTKDPTVMIISYVELVIMGPLCILWYMSIMLLKGLCHGFKQIFEKSKFIFVSKETKK